MAQKWPHSNDFSKSSEQAVLDFTFTFLVNMMLERMSSGDQEIQTWETHQEML